MNVDWKILSYFIQWHFSFIGNGRQRDRWNLKKNLIIQRENGRSIQMERHFHDSTDCTVTWSGEIKSSVWKSSGGQTKQLVPHLRDGTGGTGKFSRTKLKNNLSLYNDMMMTMTIKMATVPPTPKSAKMATTGSLLLILPLPLIQSSWLRATLTTGEQEGKGEITKKKSPAPLGFSMFDSVDPFNVDSRHYPSVGVFFRTVW